MNDLSFATIQELTQGLEKKEYSRQEVVQFFMQRFAQHDEKIKSALEIFDEASILQKTNGTGFLSGIPGIIKDNICQQDSNC